DCSMTEAIAVAGEKEVKTQYIYRFRTRQKIYTYHFWRWGAWSNWSAISPATQEGREIDRATTTYYRYRLKE
ncbi:MAG: hypothetical protein IJY09_10405, partial [Lachnospiraceae bacterium]|nr:hypothetical protein [Lachnospiraceae bacterium]